MRGAGRVTPQQLGPAVTVGDPRGHPAAALPAGPQVPFPLLHEVRDLPRRGDPLTERQARRVSGPQAVRVPTIVPGLPDLPPDLAGPVAVELAKPVQSIPRADALPGGCRYEPKWDGYRLVVVRTGSSTRLWSRQGRDLTDRFPDIVAAAVAQLPAGSVLDGEVVVWNGLRLDFGLLQRRMATAPGRLAPLVAAAPASYVAFDLLALGGTDLRRRTLRHRREQLAALAEHWAPPLQLSPITADLDEARRWFTDYRPAGVEGLVVKGRAPGTRRVAGNG
jgi:ATP-dependent DNA ligase